MDEQEISGQLGEEIEAEWAVVGRLLSKKDPASWAMAVVEAHKIFTQILGEVTYGENFEEMLHNAGSLFRHPERILAAHVVFEHITQTRIGHSVSREDAELATDDMLRGILDMTGRDGEERGMVGRMLSTINFFWMNHPNFLAGLIATVLVVVAVIWFLAETTFGQWIVGIAVGFEQFVIGLPSLLMGLVGALVLAILLGYWLAGRRDR